MFNIQEMLLTNGGNLGNTECDTKMTMGFEFLNDMKKNPMESLRLYANVNFHDHLAWQETTSKTNLEE
jgi:hypothetical protein